MRMRVNRSRLGFRAFTANISSSKSFQGPIVANG